MEDTEFCRVLVRAGIGIMDDCGTLFTKNLTKMFQKQTEFCG